VGINPLLELLSAWLSKGSGVALPKDVPVVSANTEGAAIEEALGIIPVFGGVGDGEVSGVMVVLVSAKRFEMLIFVFGVVLTAGEVVEVLAVLIEGCFSIPFEVSIGGLPPALTMICSN
jgi:hypothetical protein